MVPESAAHIKEEHKSDLEGSTSRALGRLGTSITRPEELPGVPGRDNDASSSFSTSSLILRLER